MPVVPRSSRVSRRVRRPPVAPQSIHETPWSDESSDIDPEYRPSPGHTVSDSSDTSLTVSEYSECSSTDSDSTS